MRLTRARFATVVAVNREHAPLMARPLLIGEHQNTAAVRTATKLDSNAGPR